MKWWSAGASALALSLLLTACGSTGNAASSTGEAVGSDANTSTVNTETKEERPMEERVITVTDGSGKTVTVRLNASPAADSLYAQLPLTVDLDNYSDNEKIFYPPTKLDTGDSPRAETGKPGTLAYYAPWGDVVLFYGPFRPNSELYELGTIESSTNDVSALTVGNAKIEKN